MKAALLREYGKIETEEVPVPEYGNDEVLVRVKYASICGSDQHIFKGEFHPRTKLPFIPGHEFAGVIAETGKNVKGLKPGDKVTVDPIIWCGKCAACKAGHYPACTSLKLTGIDMDGGFAEYVAVNQMQIYPLPHNISDEHAALIEVLSIGFHASNRAGLGLQDTILIQGAGKVGQSILQAVKTITRGKVFLADVLEERLDIAKKAYPDIDCINVNISDPADYIKEATDGRGVDIAFEAVGHFKEVKNRTNPVRSSIQSIKGGGKVCVLGLADEPSPLLMKELIWKEATIIASRVSHGEFSKTIEAMGKGLLKPEHMVTSILPVEEAMKGFEILDTEPEKQLKVLLKI